MLHSAFSFAQSVASGSDSMDAMTMNGMSMASMGHDMSAMDMGHPGHETGGASSFGMLAAHLLAALLCGVWLAYGERAAFRTLRAVAGRWSRRCGCCSPCPCPRTVRVSAYAEAFPTARRGAFSSFTRSLPGVHPWGPLSSETAGSPKRLPARFGHPPYLSVRPYPTPDHRALAPVRIMDDPRRTPGDHFCPARPARRHGVGGRVDNRLGAGRPRRRPGRRRAFRTRPAPRRPALRRTPQLDPQAADDLAQDTFLRALGSLHRFEGRSSARAWLLAIARRAVIDSFRHSAARPRLSDSRDWQLAAELAQPRDLPGFDDGIALLDLLAVLPDDRREAFVLTQLMGLPYAEAAEVSNCPIGTVRSRVARARATLAALLTEAEAPAAPAALAA